MAEVMRALKLPQKHNVWVPSTTRRRRKITSQTEDGRKRWKKMDAEPDGYWWLRPSTIGWPLSGGNQRRPRRSEGRRFNPKSTQQTKREKTKRWDDPCEKEKTVSCVIILYIFLFEYGLIGRWQVSIFFVPVCYTKFNNCCYKEVIQCLVVISVCVRQYFPSW